MNMSSSNNKEITVLNKTLTDRWNKSDSYNIGWKDRSLKLLELFLNHSYIEGNIYKVNEFGCGKYAPFYEILKTKEEFKVQKFDIKAWDDLTKILDFNSPSFVIPKTNISVFSGVLEYLNDVPKVLTKSIEKSDYLLISYSFLPSSLLLDEDKYIAAVLNRAVKQGWRNHYTNKDIIDFLSNIGVLTAIADWNNQLLVLLRNFSLDKHS